MAVITGIPTAARNVPIDSWANLECTKITRRENDWLFEFGDTHKLVVECPWRILAEGRIAHADEDDGQRFGLEKAVAGAERALSLLEGKRVRKFGIDEVSGDLRLEFVGGVALELWNNSSGYEAWSAIAKHGAQEFGIVAQGGGGVATWQR